MAGDGDLEVSPAAVASIQVGLRAAIAELRESGDAAGASQGAGFENLSMTGMETGHAGLATDFEDFCERWEWGVRALIQDASTLAANLGIAAGTMWEEDQYIQGAFKVAANAAYGNPHASEDEIEQKSWGDIFSADVYKPDYSAESFEKGAQDIKQTWSDTKDTVTSTGKIGSLKDLLDQAQGNGGDN
ncbi:MULTISPECIES: hypothetical protein [unclassified Streptomyces]|uniref:hypothetical protein n=1 Tax=unclassified Streptomyces TaxID=2593676 RepID=UPI00331CA434